MANLADVVNPRVLIAVGCVAGATANAAAFVVATPWGLITTRLLTGAALAWVYPPAMKVAAGWFRTHRGFALGALIGALTLGKAMPHLITTIFGSAWRMPIVITSALALLGAILTVAVVRDGPLLPATSRFDARAVRRVFAVRDVRLATAGYLGHMWELYAMWAWVATFAAASLAAAGSTAPGRDAALVAFVAIASGAAGCLAAGRLADTLGKARVARLALAASGACCLATTLGLRAAGAVAVRAGRGLGLRRGRRLGAVLGPGQRARARRRRRHRAHAADLAGLPADHGDHRRPAARRRGGRLAMGVVAARARPHRGLRGDGAAREARSCASG